MNVAIVLGVVGCAIALLWVVQSVALKIVGEPLAWPLRFTTRKPLVRWTARVMIQITWLIILAGTTFALRTPPLDALRHAFPLPVPWNAMVIASLIIFIPSSLVYALYIKVGWARLELQHEPTIQRGKLLRRFLTPIPLATVEEAVFRGVLLEQLLRSFPRSSAYTPLAIVLSAAVFSSVHFVKRPHPGKPLWQPAYGLFIIGCLFGVAYVVGRRSLWLPIAMHATAILVSEIMRLYTVYRAPPWLMGYPEYPQSGLIGSLFVFCAGVGLVVLV
jgi:membrane protease YdiL (CAAX protease family)